MSVLNFKLSNFGLAGIRWHKSCFRKGNAVLIKNLFTVIILIMLTIPCIAKAEEASAFARNFGGTLRWGTCHKPTIINPLYTTHSVSMSLLDLLFNRLVRWNSAGEIEPDLAESWLISEDGLTYIFHLKKGVLFHDGVECTAADIKFTYDRLTDPEINSPFRSSFEEVKSFDVIDKYTFRIVLKQSTASFICRLTREIVPKHLFTAVNGRKIDFGLNPIGTGPFKFKEWKENEIVLQSNQDYHEGRPFLDNIVVKIYPDSSDIWAALMRNEVDLVLFMEMEDHGVIKNNPAFKTYASPDDFYYALCYKLTNSILSSKDIRVAIAHAIDRKALIEKASFGYGAECNGPFNPDSIGFNPDVVPMEYDPEKARNILAEAGWFDGDGDGILGKEGQTLQVNLMVDERSILSKKIAMLIRQQLQEVGIKIKIVFYDDNSFASGGLDDRQEQAYLKILISGIDSDDAREEWCAKLERPGKIWGYSDEKMNKLFELGATLRNPKKRKHIYQKLHKLIYEDQRACFLYFPFSFHAVSKRIKNTDGFFQRTMPFYTLKDWYISEN
ncbi:MAG: ABC transporter substrate-binding protein [Candidatus Omnitrophota bacterium]